MKWRCSEQTEAEEEEEEAGNVIIINAGGGRRGLPPPPGMVAGARPVKAAEQTWRRNVEAGGETADVDSRGGLIKRSHLWLKYIKI